MKNCLLFSFTLICLHFFGQNFIYNGDFELGGVGVGFNINGQGYAFLSPPYSGITNPGDITTVQNPSLFNAGFLSLNDHTTGTGNMLVIDGG
ncbi:MAG: hypothetical protein ACK444_01615, partial [Flavobacteriales bacterium]